MTKSPKYMKTSATARYLGVCRETLCKWEKEGILVPLRFGRRRDRLYDKETLDNFFKMQTKQR